jgi:hypothetical protein
MTVRISELNVLSTDLSQSDALPIVDLSSAETKQIAVGVLINVGISGSPSSFIDLAKLNQSSTTKLSSTALENNGVVAGTYGSASTVARFVVNSKGLITSASGVSISVAASGISGLAPVATSGTYASLSGTPTLGTLSSQNANSVAISGGTLSGVTIVSGSATISGGTITGITDLAVADGGTGASTAAGARANLGLVIGSGVQAYSTVLDNIANSASGSDLFFYTTASGAATSAAFSSAARGVVAQVTISGMRNALGLGSVALLNSFAVTSGDISSGAVITSSLADGAVTNAKIAAGTIQLSRLANSSQSNVLLGRASASGGVYEEITCTAAARSILDDASISAIRTTLGLGTLATQNGTFSGTSTGTNTGDQTITLTGDATGTGTSTFAVTIANSAITTGKIASSAVTSDKVASGAITAVKLADQSAAVVSAASPSASGAFIGQQWLDTNTGYEYTWGGSSWIQQSAVNDITISGDTLYAFSSTYPDAFTAVITPTLNTQVANRVFVGPASGSDAAPSFRALVGSDLPTATASVKGAVYPGAGLSMTGDAIGHVNSIASGTFYKVQVDAQGHVVSGATALASGDIPALNAASITAGTFSTAFIADDAITAPKLADYSTTQFGEAVPTADFTGQFFFNPLQKDLFLWDGNVWNPVGVSIGEIVFAGTYNANTNLVASVTTEGSAVGLAAGSGLPAAGAVFNRYYLVVASGGTGTSPAPAVALTPPDILLCNGTAWTEIDVSSTYASQTASQIAVTPTTFIASTDVQAALEEISVECRNLNNVASGILDEAYGGTGNSSYTTGDILVASGSTNLVKLPVGSNGQVLVADSAQGTGVKWAAAAVGTVTSVNATAPLVVASGTSTPHLTINSASTSAAGAVQLTDSISTTSSTLAATATAVKSAYDLANAALARTGGTITGGVVIGTAGSLSFEGSINDAFETTLDVVNPTADRTIMLPNVTGTVITTGDTATVTNAMLAGSIADTKLDTIATAGKVSNSATTATSANTVSTIVARDASGNFSAGTINATIDDGTY